MSMPSSVSSRAREGGDGSCAEATRFYQRYPVSTIFGLHFAAFAIVPALASNNPKTTFILSIYLTVLGTCIFVELLFAPKVVGEFSSTGPTGSTSFVVLGIGAVATVLSAVGGTHNYAVQVGEASQAPWVSLVTPLNTWLLLGVCLILAAYSRGEVTRRLLYVTAGCACALQFGLGLAGGLVGAAASFTMAVLLMLLLTGAVRPKQFAVLGLLLVVAWPTLQAQRDDLRADVLGGANKLGGGSTPFERFWIDDQLASAERLRSSGSAISPPSWFTVVRTGTLPSAIDGPRPPIDTGSRMSVALGGSRLNATSATMPGNIWLFDGWVGLIAFYALLSFSFVRLLHRGSAWGLAVSAVLYLYFMSFSASYPDGLVRLLQDLVSFAAAALFIRVLQPPSIRRKRSRVTSRGKL